MTSVPLAPRASAQSAITKTVFTDKAAFQAALDAQFPGTRRNINWDATPISGQGTITLAADAFLASRQIILDPDFPADELLVSFPHEKQCRCVDVRKRASREIRTTSARGDRRYLLAALGCGDERRASGRTRAEKADAQVVRLWR